MSTSVSHQQTLDAAARTQRLRNTLLRRHRAEKTFRALGLTAVLLALACVAVLLTTIIARGLPAFWQSTLTLDVYFDPTLIKVSPAPQRRADESAGAFNQRHMDWQSELAMVNWNRLLEDSVIARDPALAAQRREVRALFASAERYTLRDRVMADPAIIGQTARMKLLTDANVDVWLRGNIDRSLPDAQQQLPRAVRELADRLHAEGVIALRFNTTLFSRADSRSSPASAGLLGALVGSLYMMLIVLLVAVPVGVASAVYLEEFAPRNRITDLIEININNLAAVPSIVFGLLGAAIFINWIKLPLSASLVGGLVLSLMTLPTVIITSRAALKAVPPSIRQAALGIGASKVQTVFHHVLPLARPGILTGAIIGVAQALGETAPLLLIGMSAFVAEVPATPLDPSSALPVQVFLWQGNELRNFFEARTFAAILVLLGLMVTLNALAIALRRKFEIRW
ncbi:phosphate ABC transporter permease PstA [Sinimarinibacterium sp. NLF-5-8]|uniref:phosphate ABC transporter permease PstA n=1 Tax=Sinimarinibacterium sp. NLF-5-8 TaxID=2698684 RepID=UPI00137BA144|nr:phosphate ABC transporter permease PstA [Sinimarinibacterium sp. NLF-5-8]QHS11238.1 phosphate ABC transporter permease PstA [Sinimarinibacterium sp. NLF-5-8]